MASPLNRTFNNPQEETLALIGRLFELKSGEKLRHNLFPVVDSKAFELYETQVKALWIPYEVKLANDAEQYANLDNSLLAYFPNSQQRKEIADKIKHMVRKIFGAFAGTDGLVVENLSFRFILQTNTLEQMMFYTMQNAIEAIHAHTYSLLIEGTIKDPSERQQLFEASDRDADLKAVHEWIKGYMLSPDPEAILVFIITEGIFFPAFFMCVYWLRQFNLFPGLLFANKKIAPDEALHEKYGKYRYNQIPLGQRLSQSKVDMMTDQALYLIGKVMVGMIPDGLPGLSAEYLVNFLHFLADRICRDLGYKAPYNIDINTLPAWFKEISVDEKANFYEVTVSSYQGVNHSSNPGETDFTNLEDDSF